MARNSIERLGGEYDLESRESAFSLHTNNKRQHQLHKHQQMWYYADFKRGRVLLDPLYYCVVPDI